MGSHLRTRVVLRRARRSNWSSSRAGFQITELERAFGDQYLHVEARPGRLGPPAAPNAAALAKLTELVTTFGDHVERLRTTWTERLGRLVNDGRVAVWGAGSKGVTFLNLVEPGREVRYVVDVNPNKRGLHVPGTGQMIVGPDDLVADGVDAVLVMNPLYVDEIGKMLAARGLHPLVVAVND